jgi:parallel beta-helix repeat protein
MPRLVNSILRSGTAIKKKNTKTLVEVELKKKRYSTQLKVKICCPVGRQQKIKKSNMFRHTICLIVFILASVCWGKRIIVPDNFSSILAALEESDAGDTIYVKNGIYKENIALVDNVALIGEDKEKTIIKGNRKQPVVVGADSTIIQNFTITNGSVGIFCKSTTPFIVGNLIKKNRNAGIHAIFNLPEIIGNEIQNNGQFGIFLHLVHGCKTSILSNTITGHSHSGIYCYNHTDVLIARNTFLRNRYYGVFTRDSRNVRIFENTFSKNKFPFNHMAICDNSNKFLESLVDSARHADPKDTIHSYFGIAGTCQQFDWHGINLTVDRDYFNSYFFRRHSKKISEKLCLCYNDAFFCGINSYQQAKYWDAVISFGKSLTLYPNYSLNAKALFLMANSFIQLGLIQCATKTLNRGFTNFPTSSYVIMYNLALLRIAFLEENQENIEHYYTLLHNYCLKDSVQKECDHLKKLSEEFTNNAKDTLIQRPALPDSSNKELTELESLIFTSIMKKPTNKVVESLKEYKEHYDEKCRTAYEPRYSAKITELDFNLDF